MGLVLAAFVGGALLRRVAPGAVEAAPWLDRFVLGVALPALILLEVPDLPLGADAVVPVAAAWAALGVAAVAVVVVSRLARWDRRTLGTLLLVTPLANTSFLGIAAVEALLGDGHLPAAVAYDQLGTFLALVTYGAVVAGRFGSSAAAGRATPAATVRRLLAFPPFVALLASVPLRGIALPGPAEDLLAALAALVAPVAVASLGLRFRPRVERAVAAPAVACLGVRMVLVPALALAAAVAAGGGRAWEASVLQAGMPPMVTAGVVATAAGLDERLATFVVGVGMAAAFVTLPLLAAALG